MKKRILITGASGMLGATLTSQLSKKYELYAIGNSSFENDFKNYRVFDFGKDISEYKELLKWATPDLIIHCGAITNGNFCAENTLKAFDINGITLDKFIKSTNDDVEIIYISTDAVFPSNLHLAKEIDKTNPENVYGKSKELGEFFLLNSNKKFTIIRTTIVGLNLNKNKMGFVEWIINSSKNNKPIGLFGDVFFNPISIWDLGKEIEFLIETNNINSEVLHITGTEIISKFVFGATLLGKLEINDRSVKESTINDFEGRAKRANDQTLDVSLYQTKYNRNLPNLLKTVDSIKMNYLNEN